MSATQSSAATVAVIVPYWQKAPGILSRAMRSVVAQRLTGGETLHVVVVDDASPVPARDELAGFDYPGWLSVEIVEQANGGPGHARNRGLDVAVARGATFAAFLDSDDEWHPDHVSRAVRTLGTEGDFFFADYTRFDQEMSGFEALDRLLENDPARGCLRLTPVSAEDETFLLDPGTSVEAFIRYYLAQTSTVVYRLARHAALRFDPELRGAGEDHLFWIELSAKSPLTFMCRKKQLHCGRGANVYYSALNWDDPSAATRFGYRVLFYQRLTRMFRDNAVLREHTRGKLREMEVFYGYLLVRTMLRRMAVNGDVLRRVIRASPSFTLRLPQRFLLMMAKKKQFITADAAAGGAVNA